MDKLEKKRMETETYKTEIRKEARLMGILGASIGLAIGAFMVGAGSLMLSNGEDERIYGPVLGRWLITIGGVPLAIGAIGLTGALLSMNKPKVGAIIQLCLAAALTFVILAQVLYDIGSFLAIFWLIWPALHIMSAKKLKDNL